MTKVRQTPPDLSHARLDDAGDGRLGILASLSHAARLRVPSDPVMSAAKRPELELFGKCEFLSPSRSI